MMFCYIDIETIPTQSDEAKARIADAIKPPAQMKKAETIATWEREQKAEAVADAVAKTSFDGAYGHVCCIGFAVDDDETLSTSWPLTSENETSMITSFFGFVSDRIGNRRPAIVGHNVAEFDIRFLWQRCFALGIRVPSWLPMDPKPWGDEVFDTMTAWAGPKNRISMDNLCAALGLPGKSDVDGSMVAQMFADGRHEDIAAYCRADVERTRAIHRKMMIALGEAA